MLMSKLYNKAKSVTASDPRVITPSSIPIFILPPTLDKIPTHKTELEDTFDCWSIIGEEIPEVCTIKTTTTPSENRLNKSNPNLVNQKIEENTDFLQKKFFNQLKSSPLNLIQKSAVPCSSLENLKKITRQNTKASHGGGGGGQESDTIHRKSFESKSQNSTKSLVIKNLFRSGFLNTNTLNDDLKTKENFCNLWVLHGDYKSPDSPTSNSYVKKSDSQILKSASVNNLNLINKNEEQLQREYLTNLLNQLKTEEKLSRDSSKKSKYKRDKRSKSETLLTLNSLLYGDETKYDLANALNRKSSRKRSSNLSSKCLMSSPAKNNGYGYFLDVKRNNSTDILPRRFSFRNLFKFKTSQKKLSSASINVEVQDKNIFNLEIPHKNKRNSNQSLSNSSLITDSSRLNTPLANATGSVLKFHSFKLKNIENLETNNSSKALSEPVVNRINLKTNNLNVEKNSSIKSNKSFQDDENDFDKIFNDYLSKNDSKRKDLFKETEYKNIIPTSPSISTKSYKNIFKFIFRTKSNCHNLSNGFNGCGGDDVSKHRRSRTLDAEAKNKLKFFKSKNSDLINESFKREDSNGDFENESNHDRDSLKSLNQPDLYNHFSLNNFDLFQLEKEKKSKKNRRKSSLVKSNETLYIDAGLMRNKHSYSNGKKEEKTIKSSFISKDKLILKSYIDVSFEKLQQSMHGHLISINIRNFRVEPLIEINFIKAKLSYLTFELVEPDQIKDNSNNILNGLKKKKLLAKIHKIKVKKCKFDNNLKNFSKPIDFDLVNEHFMDVSAEAMNLQMKKIFTKSNNHLNGSLDAGDVIENGSKEERKFTKFSTFESDIENDVPNEKLRKKFVFYLSIEIHSYIPVSRKILSSTFRKKKRIFKGQCQIHENFINSTQFTKNFILNEV